MLNGVEWGEYRLGDLFDINNTLSFNTDKLVDGDEYDYDVMAESYEEAAAQLESIAYEAGIQVSNMNIYLVG